MLPLNRLIFNLYGGQQIGELSKRIVVPYSLVLVTDRQVI